VSNVGNDGGLGVRDSVSSSFIPSVATSDGNNSRRLSLGELEQHLWGAANILRGPIDQADFKSYVFPLLFLKRISDVYDEEFQEALEESEGDIDYAGFAENHRFQVPAGAHWRDVRERSENVGQAIQSAMRAIEQANPNKLYGIFGDTQWTNKDRLPDSLLRDLVDHYSRLPLGNTRVEPDVLGNAYEYLIKKFADLSNKKAGEFYTPRSVVKMLVNLLDPQEGETVYDPACGTGGMLIEVVQHIRHRGGRVELLWGKVFGQEKNLTTAGIARMNLFLHGVEDFDIVRGDTLRDPAFFVGDDLATFDCVIANPPFSLEKWGDEVWSSDRFGRNFAGIPPKKSGDYAWVEHMVKSMAAKTGRLAVVLPQGALFRGGAEQRIRKHLLESDLVEAVIGLAEPLLRHRACSLRHGAAPAQGPGPPGQGPRGRRLVAVQARSQPEHARRRAARTHRAALRGVRQRGRHRTRRRPRRDCR
jgi:type I restriction enzyme M protein